jgi:acyl phosphate:glycerol-3-phosphate acyltransferase
MTHADLVALAWAPLTAYLLGAIPFGLLVTKLRGGGDLRSVGSGNIGAANVTRAAGLAAGVVTLLLDAGKGYFAVWLPAHFIHDSLPVSLLHPSHRIEWMMAAALAVILGHMFPVWLGFRGGKGVATAAGAFLMISPAAVLGAVIMFVAVTGFWRYVSLGSMAAAAALPPLMYLLYEPHFAPPHAVSFGVSLAAMLIIFRHRGNIERLLSGTEPPLTLRRRP